MESVPYHSRCFWGRRVHKETMEHCFMNCMFGKRVWRRMEGVEKALRLLPELTWRETITGIKPSRRSARSYSSCKEEPSQVWDVLCVVLIWRIWCARNRIIFRNQKFNVSEVCFLAWRDMVYVGMACHGRLIDSKSSGTEDRRLAWNEFVFQTWCKYQVFCIGDTRKPKEKLASTLTANFPIQTWDLN
jgi:hypothetical protein